MTGTRILRYAGSASNVEGDNPLAGRPAREFGAFTKGLDPTRLPRTLYCEMREVFP
jgi:hypothetical protein